MYLEPHGAFREGPTGVPICPRCRRADSSWLTDRDGALAIDPTHAEGLALAAAFYGRVCLALPVLRPRACLASCTRLFDDHEILFNLADPVIDSSRRTAVRVQYRGWLLRNALRLRSAKRCSNRRLCLVKYEPDLDDQFTGRVYLPGDRYCRIGCRVARGSECTVTRTFRRGKCRSLRPAATLVRVHGSPKRFTRIMWSSQNLIKSLTYLPSRGIEISHPCILSV